ncbi:DUF924 family protein [Vibrio sp.]|uniref:DUF924 family protein n=1 Tax=Vibrio sp. TaxID=678 RepID=UPI003D12C310
MQQEVLTFWFSELTPKQWFEVDEALDEHIRSRFAAIHAQAAQAELFSWRTTALGRLAEIIVLDQFSRNLYRNQPGAFQQDALALALAQEAVAVGADSQLSDDQRAFMYMPYMHSESQMIHQQALQLFNRPGLENNYQFELRHKAIIDRFGRYPHRNAILGRPSSDEELAFLEQPDSAF